MKKILLIFSIIAAFGIVVTASSITFSTNIVDSTLSSIDHKDGDEEKKKKKKKEKKKKCKKSCTKPETTETKKSCCSKSKTSCQKK